MDLTAAFDTVDHDLLLHLERQFGLHGVALLWFRLYLSDKSFRFFSAAVLRLCLVLWLRRPSVSMGISPVFVRRVFFWLRQLRRVLCSLDTESTKALAYAFVTSRVDYCNSVLASAPKTITDQLQQVVNAAVRLTE